MKTLLTIICFGALALAEEKPAAPRHIDFTQVLTGVDGKTINYSEAKAAGDAKAPSPMTLGDVALVALESALEEDRTMPGADKFRLDDLARRLYKNKDVVLPVEDIATIKTRIGKAFGPLVVGAAWRLLDPAETQASEKKK